MNAVCAEDVIGMGRVRRTWQWLACRTTLPRLNGFMGVAPLPVGVIVLACFYWVSDRRPLPGILYRPSIRPLSVSRSDTRPRVIGHTRPSTPKANERETFSNDAIACYPRSSRRSARRRDNRWGNAPIKEPLFFFLLSYRGEGETAHAHPLVHHRATN